MEYLLSGGLLLFFISGLIVLNKQITERPTYKDADRRYKELKVCDEIHKSVNEKLECLPAIKETVTEIKAKIDILLMNNGCKKD